MGTFGKRRYEKMRANGGMMKRVLALVCVLMMLSVSALADMDAMVFSSKMKVYFYPTTKSEQIGELPRGAEVIVEATSGEWARINYKGYVGFAQISDMLSLEPARAKVNKTSAIMYITPDNMTPQSGTLSRGTTVYVRSINGDLLMVSDKDMNILAVIPAANVTYSK